MRVLVDTSVWVDFLNGFASPEATSLRTLITGDEEICTTGVIVAEVFQGLKRSKSSEKLRALFDALTFLEPAGIETYYRAAGLFRELRAKGVTVRSTIDCVIIVIAEHHGCHVLARDRDFDAILRSGLAGVSPAARA